MRTVNIDAKASEFKTAHLFEIELATLVVISEDNPNTNKIKVDDIDKCFIGQRLAIASYSSNLYTVIVAEVTALNHILSEITINTSVSIKKGMLLCETLHTALTVPRIVVNGSDKTHYLEFLHSFYGTFTGRVLMTDYDLPIIVNSESDLFAHLGISKMPLLYLPFPVSYKDVAVETRGKMNSVELTMANIDQMMGSIMFQHNGLRNRDIIIKTVFLNDSVKSSLGYTYNTAANQYVIPSATTGNEPDMALNEGFFDCIYANENNVVIEFLGETNSINFDDKQLSINAIVSIDDTENTLIPKRIYSRIQCHFIYKDNRCRFRSGMKLESGIDAVTLDLPIITVDKFFYLEGLKMNPATQTSIENHVIQIGEEQMLVERFSMGVWAQMFKMTNDQIRALKNSDDPAERQKYKDMTTHFHLIVKTRGYNNTTATTHSANDVVDMVYCRKTEHDCELHAKSAYFGGFPSIPKNRTYGSGY